jgi:glutathione S-transferase
MRLVTIGVSHYCEKARWALERAGVAYTEERHAPPFHILAAWRTGGRRTVPVLVADGGVHPDSTDILQHVDRLAGGPGRLYPEAEAERRDVEQLEELFDTQLGPHTRRWAYFHLLDHPELVRRVLLDGVGAGEQAAFRGLWPGIRVLIRKALRITPESAERSRRKVDEGFATVADRLADGRRYLVADRFTAADLTFAALASPVLCPPEYGAWLPPLDQLPEAVAAAMRAWQQTPAGRYALRLYRDERRAPARSAGVPAP